jgi:hypothetical protein
MIYDENGIWQPKPEERMFSNGNVMALQDHYEEIEGYKSHEGGVTLCKICDIYFDTYAEFSTHYQTHSKKEQGMENESDDINDHGELDNVNGVASWVCHHCGQALKPNESTIEEHLWDKHHLWFRPMNESNARPKYWTDAWGDICPKCNGTGDYNCGNKSKADCICPRCNGSGVISNESKEDDIDWTEDKPEGDIPFYCPINVIFF